MQEDDALLRHPLGKAALNGHGAGLHHFTALDDFYKHSDIAQLRIKYIVQSTTENITRLAKRINLSFLICQIAYFNIGRYNGNIGFYLKMFF